MVLISHTDASCHLQSETDAVSESHVCLILSSARPAHISYSSAINNKIHVHMMSEIPPTTLTKYWYSGFQISCNKKNVRLLHVFFFYIDIFWSENGLGSYPSKVFRHMTINRKSSGLAYNEHCWTRKKMCVFKWQIEERKHR